MSDTEKKILFVFLLLLIIGLKIYGIIGGKLAWPMIIILGFVAVITEPSLLACDSLPGEQSANG